MKHNQVRQVVFPILTAFIWGTSFVAQDICADAMGAFTFNKLIIKIIQRGIHIIQSFSKFLILTNRKQLTHCKILCNRAFCVFFRIKTVRINSKSGKSIFGKGAFFKHF